MYLLGNKNSFLDDKFKKIGKKTFNLHLMKHALFNVPEGVVITYDQWALESGKNDFDLLLEQYVHLIGGFPVVVRSSGQLEDLNNASLAGLYQTFLEVNGIAELKETIKKCFKSATYKRISECLKKMKNTVTNSDLSEVNLSEDFLKKQVSVLVQKMVDSNISGVAFTVDPLTGKEEHVRIEAVKGLGKKLLSGIITPTTFVIDNKDGMLINYYEGDEIIELKTEQLLELVDNVFRIQAYFKSPQGVKWSVDSKGKLWILQSMPITNIKWRTDFNGYSKVDLKDEGVSFKVCTPMMFSLYNMAMSYGMDRYFKNLNLKKENIENIKNIVNNKPGKKSSSDKWMIYKYGRAYWNARLAKQLLFKIPGFNEKAFDDNLGIEKDYGAKGPHRTQICFKTIIEAISLLIALNKEYKNSLKMSEDFKKKFPTIIEKYLKKLENIKIISCDDFYKDFQDIFLNLFFNTETSYLRIVYNNINFQSDFENRLKFSPITKIRFRSSLKKSRHFLTNREKMREFSTITYSLIIKYLLEMGNRLKELGFIECANDIFFFYIDELIEFCSKKTFSYNFFDESSFALGGADEGRNAVNRISMSVLCTDVADSIKKELKYRKIFYKGMTNINAPNSLKDYNS
ncbi:MAG: hypothetical protein HQK51_00170 [Oligoflexia bacterium]|nr:hypothetical protein [Oligoflexia bacterium]